MKKRKAYRATDVKRVNLRLLQAGRDGLAVVVGIDVGKGFVLVVLRWQDGRFERPWKVSNPLEIPLLVALLGQLRQGRQLLVALEPTGTYADSLRQMLHDHGLLVHRVSPKQAHDYAEVFDGVPSAHDGKDAAVIADLAATGKSAQWPFVLSEHDQEMAYWVRKLDVCRRDLARAYGRLEGLLARHFPEAAGVLKLSSGTLLRALQYYGGPQALAEDPEAKERLLGWGGVLLKPEKVELLLRGATGSVGVRQMPADVRWVKEVATEALRQRQQMRECGRQLRLLAKGNEVIARQAEAVGVATACVLWVKLGDPKGYHCACAYRKAMGLNLAEYSSGRWEGKKRLSRRGSSAVRRALYFGALRLVKKTGGNVRRWYEAKKERDGGEAKRALVGVMRKLALGLYHVGNGAAFDPGKVFAAVAQKG